MFVSGSHHAPTSATILHADLDSFYASIEQRDDPQLRGRPVLVGGGVVLAASYEAKAFGIRTPMNLGEARRLCPNAVVVAPRMEAYAEASKQVFEIFGDTTPLVEGLSIDEAFLDVSGLRRIAGSPRHIAKGLRARVSADVGLNITVGVARTKFLAKVASGVAKPDGLLVVDPERELEFLRPLAVERLWGVGPKTAAKLQAVQLHTVGDVADTRPDLLVSLVGAAAGNKIHRLSHNLDPRPVQVGKRRSSVGSQCALGRGNHTRAAVGATLYDIIDRIGQRLRQGDRVGRTVTLRVRFDDFTRITRSHTVAEATNDTRLIAYEAQRLLDGVWPTVERNGITLVGASLGNLCDASSVQLALPFTDRDFAPAVELDATLDEVKERFGSAAIGRAATLGTHTGFRVPMLPDDPSTISQ